MVSPVPCWRICCAWRLHVSLVAGASFLGGGSVLSVSPATLFQVAGRLGTVFPTAGPHLAVSREPRMSQMWIRTAAPVTARHAAKICHQIAAHIPDAILRQCR